MFLHLIRHAHAVREEENPLRPLSERGREDTRRLAAFLKPGDQFRPAQIWHSPLARSRETADLLVGELQLDGPVIETPDLLPEDDPDEIARRIREISTMGSLAIVGHEPHLSALATLLVRGKKRPEAFDFKKAAILTLERTSDFHKRTGEPRWVVTWFVTPSLLTKVSGTPAGKEPGSV